MLDFVAAPLPYRNAFGSVFLPYKSQLEEIGGPELDSMMLFGFCPFDSATLPGLVNGQVAGQATSISGFTTPENCWVTHIVASGVVQGGGNPSFAVQFYDTGRQQLWSGQPILFGNTAGSAQQPFWLKKVYRLPTANQFQCRVTNFLTSPTAIQIVLWGLRA